MQNPLSLEAFITWLRSKPANGRYRYAEADNCLNAQYLRDKGFDVVGVGTTFWFDSNGQTYSLPKAFNEAAVTAPKDSEDYRTFSGALAEAEKLQQEGQT